MTSIVNISEDQVRVMLDQIYRYVKEVGRENAIMMSIYHDSKRYDFPYSPYPLVELWGQEPFDETADYNKFAKELTDGVHDDLVKNIIKSPFVLKFEFVTYQSIARYTALSSSSKFQLSPRDRLGSTY